MKNLYAILALIILLAAGLACSDSDAAQISNTGDKPSETNTAQTTSGSEDGIYIESVTLYADNGNGEEGEKVESFKPTDNPQHFNVKLSEFESGTRVKAVMTAINAGGAKNFKLLEKEVTMLAITNTANFSLSLSKPFPPGDYKIDVYINDKLSKTVNYKVQ